jgi:hypothetical protein
MMEHMSFLRTLLIIAPAACLLAQTPPAAPTPAPATPPAAGRLATPVPPGLLAPAPAPPTPVTVPPDRVVLKAGSMTLTAGQFEGIIGTLPDRVQAMYRGPGRRQLAENLAMLFTLADEAKRRNLDQGLAYTVKLDQVLAGLVAEQLRAEAKVSEADARKYYDDNLKNYEEVTARRILIRFKGTPTPLKPGAKELTEEEALAKANDLRKRIVGGEDFATVAKAESDDTTASNGGLMPPFPKGRNVPSFDDAAFSLKPGEVSQPVKTPAGYQLIKVDAHTIKTFEEVRPQIEKTLIPQVAQKTMQEMTKSAFYDPEYFPPQPPPMPHVPPAPPTLAAPAKPAVPPVPPVPAAPPAPAAPPKQ